MATLKDYKAPATLFKEITGQPKIESFATIRDRFDKTAKDVGRDADKLTKAIEKIEPDNEKLKGELQRILDGALRTLSACNDTASLMRDMASGFVDTVRDLDNTIKSGVDDARALENMYSTLAKALDKAAKSKNPKDEQAAEIAGKAYEKACKNAKKNLYALGMVSKKVMQELQKAVKFEKLTYLDSIINMKKTMDGLSKFGREYAQDINRAGRDMELVRRLSK